MAKSRTSTSSIWALPTISDQTNGPSRQIGASATLRPEIHVLAIRGAAEQRRRERVCTPRVRQRRLRCSLLVRERELRPAARGWPLSTGVRQLPARVSGPSRSGVRHCGLSGRAGCRYEAPCRCPTRRIRIRGEQRRLRVRLARIDRSPTFRQQHFPSATGSPNLNLFAWGVAGECRAGGLCGWSELPG
jgi:hypothetical protein